MRRSGVRSSCRPPNTFNAVFAHAGTAFFIACTPPAFRSPRGQTSPGTRDPLGNGPETGPVSGRRYRHDSGNDARRSVPHARRRLRNLAAQLPVDHLERQAARVHASARPASPGLRTRVRDLRPLERSGWPWRRAVQNPWRGRTSATSIVDPTGSSGAGGMPEVRQSRRGADAARCRGAVLRLLDLPPALARHAPMARAGRRRGALSADCSLPNADC